MEDRKIIRIVTDARGQRVTQLDPFALRLRRRFDVIPREDLEAIAGEIGSGLNGALTLSLALILCGIVLAIVGAGFMIFDLLSGNRPSAALLFRGVVGIALPASVSAFTWIGATRQRSEKTKRILLAHHRCPHCGYDLRGSPADETDGATVCAECGSAWKLSGPPSLNKDAKAE